MFYKGNFADYLKKIISKKILYQIETTCTIFHDPPRNTATLQIRPL
jgi:hypothetical protein